LIKESSEKFSLPEGNAKDASLICAAQKVEYCEIAGYGTVRTFARLLGYRDVAKILQATLDEEADTDRKLADLAGAINLEAEFSEARA
jgi:ferritin-like metal-binding protein YciE